MVKASRKAMYWLLGVGWLMAPGKAILHGVLNRAFYLTRVRNLFRSDSKLLFDLIGSFQSLCYTNCLLMTH